MGKSRGQDALATPPRYSCGKNHVVKYHRGSPAREPDGGELERAKEPPRDGEKDEVPDPRDFRQWQTPRPQSPRGVPIPGAPEPPDPRERPPQTHANKLRRPPEPQ
jgi:hypothetical protein